MFHLTLSKKEEGFEYEFLTELTANVTTFFLEAFSTHRRIVVIFSLMSVYVKKKPHTT